MTDFKVGDKVKCIDNFTNEKFLTIGKEYIIHRISGRLLYCYGDNGKLTAFFPHRFILVEEQSNNEINHLDILKGY